VIIDKYKKEREENKNKKLILLGTAVSCFQPDYNSNDYEFWATGSSFGNEHYDIKRIDLGFEIHPIGEIAQIAQERQVDYNKFDCPIFVQDATHPIAKQLMNKPETFPLDDMLEYAKENNFAKYFTSSFCYMLVYAAMLGYKDISMYKILLTSDSEYFLERPGVEYWLERLGVAEDITFHFPEDAEFWSGTVLYGFEQRPNIWKLQSRKKYLWEVYMRHFYDIERLVANINRNTGMLEMFHILQRVDKDKVNKILEACKKGLDESSVKYRGSRDKYMQFCGALQTIQFHEMRQF
jgi:hypothetical protein